MTGTQRLGVNLIAAWTQRVGGAIYQQGLVQPGVPDPAIA